MRYRWWGLLVMSYITQVHAKVSLGGVAQNAMVPASIIAHSFYMLCYIVGIGFFLTGLVQYRMHRQSPQEVHLSRVFMLLILGVLLFCLPFIGQHSVAGQHL